MSILVVSLSYEMYSPFVIFLQKFKERIVWDKNRHKIYLWESFKEIGIYKIDIKKKIIWPETYCRKILLLEMEILIVGFSSNVDCFDLLCFLFLNCFTYVASAFKSMLVESWKNLGLIRLSSVIIYFWLRFCLTNAINHY